ncbi:MAG: CbiX/SirB N-terminal domain-containing protein [Betaproteobacteria bacterium]|jgi:Uncharacterized conserved protein|nr:CbiX/SirB N-terminal domain-containing protein [Betaproteobacteria bacterium]
MHTGILLFAHGARDPRWAEPFVIIRDKLQRHHPTYPVELCFLEWMRPSLAEAVEIMLQKQCSDLVLIPLFMAQGGHLREDLPRLIDALKKQYPRLRLTVTQALGESPELLDAIARWAAAQIPPFKQLPDHLDPCDNDRFI